MGEQKKRIIFVLTKADLITPEMAAKWLLVLGQITPTVCVAPEAGREGVQELLLLLGHAKATSGSAAARPQLPAATAVGVLGYSGTGKRSLCKAIRQELKTTAPWLFEPCRLNPVAGKAPTASSALHTVICTNVPRGAANATSAAAIVASNSSAGAISGVEPVDVITEFLGRAQQQAVLRHFRLPTFNGADEFLKTFCQDRKLKTKKGKVPQPPAIAQRILTELPALPGCFCVPPEGSSQGAQNYWSLHGDARQGLQSVMEQQVAALKARGVSGPAATALAITSGAGLGPSVDIVGTLDDGEAYIPGEDDVSDSQMSDDDMVGEESEEDLELLEGEEEEELSDLSDEELSEMSDEE